MKKTLLIAGLLLTSSVAFADTAVNTTTTQQPAVQNATTATAQTKTVTTKETKKHKKYRKHCKKHHPVKKMKKERKCEYDNDSLSGKAATQDDEQE